MNQQKKAAIIKCNSKLVSLFLCVFAVSISWQNIAYAQLPTDIKSVAAGRSHSIFLKNDGTVWTAGYNVSGALGDSTTDDHSTAIQVPGLTGIVSVAAGAYFSMFLKNDGTVWACGENSTGQLGDGTDTERLKPVLVKDLTHVVAISGGDRHALFLKDDSTVWGAGDNCCGQLGVGDFDQHATPTQVSGLSGVVAIDAGGFHSLFLKNDGTVWGAGDNMLGQLANDTVLITNVPVPVGNLTDIVAVDGGMDHSLFLKNDGTVWGCGYNAYGQVGDGSDTNHPAPVQVFGMTDVIKMSGGDMHSLFLKNDGTAWGVGFNAFGSLGDGTETDRLTAVQVSGVSNVTQIVAGGEHSIFLEDGCDVFTTGYNSTGQLADGTYTDRDLPGLVMSLCTTCTPDVSNFTATTATSVCTGRSVMVTMHSTTLLADTVYTVNYTLSGAGGNTGTFTSAPFVYSTGSGTFTIDSNHLLLAGATTVTINYISKGACNSATPASGNSANFSVYSLPAITSIGSTNPACEEKALTLTSAISGGTTPYTFSWSGPNSFSSTLQSPLVTLSASPTEEGTYYLAVADAHNCPADTGNTMVTVHPARPISGINSVTFGGSFTLSNEIGGGSWATATPWTTGVGASTGVVKGISAGTSVITYTTGAGCTSTHTVLVLSGAHACVGQTITISDGGTGGTWTSGAGSIATVGLTTGIVTGVAAGNVVITHRPAAGGIITTTVTVHPLAATVSTASAVCQGQSLVLTNSTAGGGTWYSGNTSTAVMAGSTLTGLTGGSAVIYFTPVSGCVTTKTITISPVAPITGTNSVCVGQTTAFSNAMSGGAWSTSSGALANVNSGGMVTGIAAGTPRVSYILPTSGCYSTATVTVKPLTATTTAATTVCSGRTVTYTNTTAGGGTWTSSNTNIAIVSGGTVTGTGAGVAAISFNASNGCVSSKNVTVNGAATISGTVNVCVGQITNLSNSIGGGAWSSSSGALATVSSAGVVGGIAAGSPRISYIMSGTGCYTTVTVTVNALSPITGGTAGICASSSMTLANATPFGGVWSSSNTSAATVNPSTGFVKGTGAGSTVVSFTTNAGGCVATRNVTVNACRESGGTAAVIETITKDDVRLYPNPNNGQFTLAGMLANVIDGELGLEVVNVLGQTIYRDNVQVRNGSIEKRIELPGTLAHGTYILNLKTGDGNKPFRFVIQ